MTSHHPAAEDLGGDPAQQNDISSQICKSFENGVQGNDLLLRDPPRIPLLMLSHFQAEAHFRAEAHCARPFASPAPTVKSRQVICEHTLLDSKCALASAPCTYCGSLAFFLSLLDLTRTLTLSLRPSPFYPGALPRFLPNILSHPRLQRSSSLCCSFGARRSAATHVHLAPSHVPITA